MANESFAMTCLSAPFMHKSLNQSTPCPAEIAGEVVAPAVDAVAEARPDDVDRPTATAKRWPSSERRPILIP